MTKSKKLSEQNAPPSLLPPTPLIMGLSYGEQSLQSPTLTRPPARESSNALMVQYLYIWGEKPHLLPCGNISFTLTRRSLVLMPSLFRYSAVVNLNFCVQVRQVCWARTILDIFELDIFLQLEFSDNDRFKAGVHVKAVLTSLNTAFLPFCHVLSNAKSLCLFP